jgi:hypothetical protein
VSKKISAKKTQLFSQLNSFEKDQNKRLRVISMLANLSHLIWENFAKPQKEVGNEYESVQESCDSMLFL